VEGRRLLAQVPLHLQEVMYVNRMICFYILALMSPLQWIFVPERHRNQRSPNPTTFFLSAAFDW
jgi:hypothetical protein